MREAVVQQLSVGFVLYIYKMVVSGFTVYVPVCLSAGCFANKTFASSFRVRVCKIMMTSSRDRTAVG